MTSIPFELRDKCCTFPPATVGEVAIAPVALARHPKAARAKLLNQTKASQNWREGRAHIGGKVSKVTTNVTKKALGLAPDGRARPSCVLCLEVLRLQDLHLILPHAFHQRCHRMDLRAECRSDRQGV